MDHENSYKLTRNGCLLSCFQQTQEIGKPQYAFDCSKYTGASRKENITRMSAIIINLSIGDISQKYLEMRTQENSELFLHNS